MITQIRIGDFFKSDLWKNREEIPAEYEQYRYLNWSNWQYKGDFRQMIDEVYKLVTESENLLIDNADHFCTYIVNNLIMRDLVDEELHKCVFTPEEEEYARETQERVPTLKKHCEIIEYDDEGDETCIQDEDGNIGENWQDKFMTKIMDDFYALLNFYPEKED